MRSDLIDPAIAAHHGRIVKPMGDGRLVEFGSVVDAVRCAIDVQQGMVERNAGSPAGRRIEFRVGIHLGDVVEASDGDLMGDGVNIAARLEGIAEPGAICLSAPPTAGAATGRGARFSDLGRRGSRTSPTRPRLCARVGKPALAERAPAACRGKSAPPRLSIVVLPFANIGGDPEQDYFVDGVTESLTTDLSRIRGSSSSRATPPSPIAARCSTEQIGRELNVRYVLEGSVQRGGNRIRVNVQLIDAETGAHLWAERFDKPVADSSTCRTRSSRAWRRAEHPLVAAEARRADGRRTRTPWTFIFKDGVAQQGAGSRASRERTKLL